MMVRATMPRRLCPGSCAAGWVSLRSLKIRSGHRRSRPRMTARLLPVPMPTSFPFVNFPDWALQNHCRLQWPHNNKSYVPSIGYSITKTEPLLAILGSRRAELFKKGKYTVEDAENDPHDDEHLPLAQRGAWMSRWTEGKQDRADKLRVTNRSQRRRTSSPRIARLSWNFLSSPTSTARPSSR